MTLPDNWETQQNILVVLAHPDDPETNDPVRVRTRRDPPGTRYLTGELFAAFGSPW